MINEQLKNRLRKIRTVFSSFSNLCSLILLFLALSCGKPEQLIQSPDYSAANGNNANNLNYDSMPSLWSQSVFPLEFKSHSQFSAEEKTHINAMIEKWNEGLENERAFINFSASSSSLSYESLNDYRDNELGIYPLYTWPRDLPATALAVTQIFGRRVGTAIRIEHADILMNYDRFTFHSNDDNSYDFKTVVLHELGHFLGLYHESNPSLLSIMQPAISRFDKIQSPQPIDKENLQQKYAQLYSAQLAQRTLMAFHSEQSLPSRTPSSLEAASQEASHSFEESIEVPLEPLIRIRLYLLSDGTCLFHQNHEK